MRCAPGLGWRLDDNRAGGVVGHQLYCPLDSKDSVGPQEMLNVGDIDERDGGGGMRVWEVDPRVD